jgi:hypothetical protein
MGAGAATGAGVGEVTPARARLRTAVLVASVLLLATVAALLNTAHADALIHRGHSFESALELSGSNKLSSPSAVGVNDATSGNGAGDIYVLDKGNNRVVRFGPNHEFLEAWGAGVNGGSEYERCKVEAECKPGVAGLSGISKPKFDEPVGIAVDNAIGSPSFGDVYVIANRTWKKAIIYKFDFEGKFVGSLAGKAEEKEELWPIDGVVVDNSGKVWVDREDEEEEFVIQRFTAAEKNQLIGEAEEVEFPEVISGHRTARPGFAVDALGRVYVTYELNGRDIEEEEELIEERAEQRKENKEEKIEEHIADPCVQHECDVARYAPGEGTAILAGEAEIATFDPETNTTGIAVDTSTGQQSSSDVYLDHVSFISALLSGGSSVQQGTLIQEFGQEQLSAGRGAGLAVNPTNGEVFAADEAQNRVDIFEPTKAGKPVIAAGALSVAKVTGESAELKALIEPLGADTHAYFRYGTEPCSSGPTACASSAPALPGEDISSGFGDHELAVNAVGLSPETKYDFVAVAENSFGEVISSEEGTFTTLPAVTLEEVLPDGRAWELVSPVDKRGVAVEPISHEGGLIQAADNGRRFAFIAAAPVGEEEPAGNRAPEPSQLIASRTGSGSWSTHNLTTPNAGAQGVLADLRREYEFFSSDLSLAAVFPPEPLASGETTEASSGLPEYIRSTTCASGACYTPLLKASTLGAGNSPLGAATPDLKHIGLSTAEGLFEWSAEEPHAGESKLRQVSILPNGQPASGALGFGLPVQTMFQGARNSISHDGSHIVWANVASDGTHLYQSELKAGSAESIQVDEQNKEAGLSPSTVPAQPVYQTSSVEGDRLFFTDDQRLTENASFGTNPASGTVEENEEAGDLYVFERGKSAGERLTDLTPDLNFGESSNVQPAIVGASDDGAYVYFVANGVLAEGAAPGHCVREGLRSAKCNLYEVHNNGSGWEKPRLIARLSNEDGPDWGPIQAVRTQYKVDELTARVSPNGQFLAFMSNQRLTKYDNNDLNSGQPDEEVFLFNAGTGKLVCASCNPTGAQPEGVHDVQESGEGRGLLIDRLGIWSTETEGSTNDSWLAANVPGWTNLDDRESFYQSRYLSDTGRLFFNAADSLVKEDVNKGKADVYQYEPLGVGDCAKENTTGGCVSLISSGKSAQESTFLDASENGNDVFFLTSSALIPSLDTDKAFDIYDARVCAGPGAEEACPTTALPPAAPCEGEECRAAPAPAVSPPATLGSATTSSSGNLSSAPVTQQVLGTKTTTKPKPLTRAQKLAAALKSCKKKYKSKKTKRAACEKQARKKYGVKSTAKPHKSASKSTKAKG